MTRAPFWSATLLAAVFAFAPPARAGSDGKEIVSLVPSWNELLRRPLSLADALNIAAEQNAVILAARKDVEARYGIALQVRAIVLPKVIAEGAYLIRQDSLIEQNHHRELPSFHIVIPELGIDTTIGGGNRPKVNNQSWTADVRIVQSIYEGGRMLSALRQTRLIREQALLDFETTVADVLLNVRVAYDEAQLAGLQIKLREQSVALLGGLLGKIQEQRKVGAVTEFEELRAQLEQANAGTPLALSGQDYVIAKLRLIQLMGYDIPVSAGNGLPLELSTPLRAPKYPGSLGNALVAATRQRSELAAIRVAGKLGDEAIIVARAGTKPSAQAFVGYEFTSRVQSRDAGDPYHGALAGVQINWPIFDGFLTRGRVTEATARRGEIAHNTDELERQITVQVRSAWEQMVQAKTILETQAGNVRGAGRTIELAETRYTTGIGSEVEVLSAQTAITDARDIYATALRNYSVAYSRLLRATGEDMERTGAQR